MSLLRTTKITHLLLTGSEPSALVKETSVLDSGPDSPPSESLPTSRLTMADSPAVSVSIHATCTC